MLGRLMKADLDLPDCLSRFVQRSARSVRSDMFEHEPAICVLELEHTQRACLFFKTPALRPKTGGVAGKACSVY